MIFPRTSQTSLSTCGLLMHSLIRFHKSTGRQSAGPFIIRFDTLPIPPLTLATHGPFQDWRFCGLILFCHLRRDQGSGRTGTPVSDGSRRDSIRRSDRNGRIGDHAHSGRHHGFLLAGLQHVQLRAGEGAYSSRRPAESMHLSLSRRRGNCGRESASGANRQSRSGKNSDR